MILLKKIDLIKLLKNTNTLHNTTHIMTDLFIESSLKFESKNNNDVLVPVPIKDAKFGILSLNAISTPLTQKELEFIFMIDSSGSMSDKCSDGRTKMQHIIHTVKNMILYFKENPSIKINITINSFDDMFHRVLGRCSVTDENYNSIISKIDGIIPLSTTNIEFALKSVKQTIESIKQDFPDHDIINIFMTDGEATSGNTDYTYLANIVDRTITNAFIGFGIDHDSKLLNAISKGENSAYYFIDKLENSGFVYGEILHGIVYKFLSNVQISVINGLIYDFKNNIWSENLSIGEIVSEANKKFHIISNNTDECAIILKAKQEHNSTEVNLTIVNHKNTEDFTNYIYRQRTLQHLFSVDEFFKKKNSYIYLYTSLPFDLSISDKIKEDKRIIKENLRAFLQEMKQFMEENNLNDDKFMKNLCDDIYISYKTFGTHFGYMYNNARQTSQGMQRCYTVSHTPEIEPETNNLYCPSHPRLQRYNNIISDTQATTPIDDDQLYINHTMSNFNDTPYLTQTATQIIRDISCTSNIYD